MISDTLEPIGWKVNCAILAALSMHKIVLLLPCNYIQLHYPLYTKQNRMELSRMN